MAGFKAATTVKLQLRKQFSLPAESLANSRTASG